MELSGYIKYSSNDRVAALTTADIEKAGQDATFRALIRNSKYDDKNERYYKCLE